MYEHVNTGTDSFTDSMGMMGPYKMRQYAWSVYHTHTFEVACNFVSHNKVALCITAFSFVPRPHPLIITGFWQLLAHFLVLDL